MTLIDLGCYPITTGLCIAQQEGGEIRGWIKAIRGRNQGVDQSNQRDVGLLHNLDPRGTLIIGILCDMCVLLTAYHQLSSVLECKQHRLIRLPLALFIFGILSVGFK